MVHIDGATVESTKVSGKTIKWRVRASSPGLMAESMSEIILMIRKRVTVYFTGQTDANMTECGLTVSRTVLERIQSQAVKQKQVSGKTGGE